MTPAQLATLKTNILANTNTVTWLGASTQIKDVPNNGDGNAVVAVWYNLPAAGPWMVWRDLPMEQVLSLITFASMTPLDAVPTTPDLAIQLWLARAIACQGKQFNLQNLIMGRTTAPMKQLNYRAAMQDCLTSIPAGASGALIAANWVGVRDAAKFSAINFEKLFSTGTGSTATPADLVLEGSVSGLDVEKALSLL